MTPDTFHTLRAREASSRALALPARTPAALSASRLLAFALPPLMCVLMALALVIASPSGARAAQASAAPQPLALEEFFAGHALGTGTFVSELADVERDFTVGMSGKWDPKTRVFILREAIVYADGEREDKVWTFQKLGPGRYIGRRPDVRGLTQVFPTPDGALEFTYITDVMRNGKPQAIRFTDRLERVDRTTVRNTARASFLGLTVGTVDITFKK
ncbi:DUF3833 family protein [Roseibium aestuarii]|uniref:DUF3833 family protein n=1 Tax=Roseibium aestuarii TaxID=2600299 RepID=A0ABW4JT85_9HYPH|nr:DUF3833 family protein [Roseibium aestuarii]